VATFAHDPPQLFVLAGPNGAGKSTTARVLLPEALGIDQFVNADAIAAGLSPFAPQSAEIEAGKLMLRRMREFLGSRRSFAFETTLAGKGHLATLREARERGYLIHVSYVWVRSPELAVERVSERVRQGGHAVPADVVRRRYHRGLANFLNLYRPLADAWTLCDNSDATPKVIAQGSLAGGVSVYHPSALKRIEESVHGSSFEH